MSSSGLVYPSSPAWLASLSLTPNGFSTFLKSVRVSKDDAAKALQDPAKAAGVVFTDDALDEVFGLTKGYPYFIQEWGYQSWNTATASPITKDDVDKATATIIARLDKNFFRVRYDRLTPSEKNFLRAMAELGPGPYRTGDIAAALKLKTTDIGTRRANLIKKGMIYSPEHGLQVFTVPLFDGFMKRAIPEFGKNE